MESMFSFKKKFAQKLTQIRLFPTVNVLLLRRKEPNSTLKNHFKKEKKIKHLLLRMLSRQRELKNAKKMNRKKIFPRAARKSVNKYAWYMLYQRLYSKLTEPRNAKNSKDTIRKI